MFDTRTSHHTTFSLFKNNVDNRSYLPFIPYCQYKDIKGVQAKRQMN